MRLLFVQFAGDYREAVFNFAAGKTETYYAQKYSVDSVAQLTHWLEAVTVLCCTSQEVYNEVLPSGVRAIGAGFPQRIPTRELIQLIAAQQPTHLILDVQQREVLNWAARNQVRTITLFSGSVPISGWKSKIRNPLLARALNHPQIDWVGSYGINSSLRLQQLGVNADKIIPWDFVLETSPGDLSSKQARTDGQPWTVFYVGSMIEGKGVGDILGAIAHLKQQGTPVKARLAGADQVGIYAAQAQSLQIADQVEFLGIIGNQTVEPLMREADIVLIPSRHNYTEGFPLTIHHALKSRTPIIASDHPMFRNKLQHDVNALVVPAANPVALAESIQRLQSDPALYFKLSNASYETWYRIRLPVKWGDLIERWLRNTESDQQWLFENRLNGEYCRARLESYATVY
jgi:glycosyltransferase involved in cell wall biosynthesis